MEGTNERSVEKTTISSSWHGFGVNCFAYNMQVSITILVWKLFHEILIKQYIAEQISERYIFFTEIKLILKIEPCKVETISTMLSSCPFLYDESLYKNGQVFLDYTELWVRMSQKYKHLKLFNWKLIMKCYNAMSLRRLSNFCYNICVANILKCIKSLSNVC